MNIDIIKIAKSMKKEYINITPKYILGTDINTNTLSIIYTESEEEYLGTIAELEGKGVPEFAECMTEEILRGRFAYLLTKIAPIALHQTVSPIEGFECIDISENENFLNTSKNIKAKDGARMFKLNEKYIMSNFSSLHPINKSDKVYLSLYPYDNISYMSKFVIDKKKYEIHEYIRYLYL